MLQLIYDDTFAGFLTCIFEKYDRKLHEIKIVSQQSYVGHLFDQNVAISTDEAKADRVLQGAKKYGHHDIGMVIYSVFLSESADRERLLLDYLSAIFDERKDLSTDYTRDYVLKIHQITKQMHRETHRMHAFVRFEKTVGDIYCAGIQPDFDVLPLAIGHFEKRYADQQWLIYDLQRKYGYFYDLHKVEQVTIELPTEYTVSTAQDSDQYQALWKTYFDAVNIPERKNLRLHLRHVPKRYWKYLPEKYL